MAAHIPRPEDGEQPDDPAPDMPDTDEKKRPGPDEITDPANPDEIGGGRPAGVPTQVPLNDAPSEEAGKPDRPNVEHPEEQNSG